ncbi:MAG: hypothetical protein HRU13_10845, partial [Phycisphaerales bacterium]|nr:hypothetical protein [Phycisphaerales bacterium]
MARKKLVVVCGQSNAGPIGDIQTWEDENPLLALRSPQYSAQRVPQFGQGSYGDLFTMPGTFPGGPTVDNVGALTIGQWQQVDLRGKAMQQVRVLTFANPLPSFVTFNAQTRDYPHTARVVTGSQSGRLQVNLLSQPARAPRTASAIDTATNTITSVGHGFTGNQRVAVTSSELSGVPAGLEARGTYSVTVVDDDNFTLTEWPSGDAVDITSAGSGTINFHEADRGTITRVSTGTTHTACCGGPGTQGSASTSGYTLNVDPPFVPAPREGEQFRYELRSSGQQMSRRLLEFDFAFGGIHDLGGLPTETLVRQPVNPDAPAKFICQREPFYAGRPVQLQQNEQTDLVAFGVLLGIDTSNDTTACSPASANFSDGDAVIYHANGG